LYLEGEAGSLDESCSEEDEIAADTYAQMDEYLQSNCRLHYGDKSSNPLDYKWGVLICDEAQCLRRVGSAYWNMVASIICQLFWPCSATPMLDSIADIRGFATIIWYQTRLPIALPSNS
jgi:hypothetical protein